MIEIRRSALVKYSPAQMFELVNDVEAYPKRFAWCAGAEVLERGDDVVVARLDLKFAGFRQSFTTRNVLTRPKEISLALVNGPFRTLEGRWSFEPIGEPAEQPDGGRAEDRQPEPLDVGRPGIVTDLVDDGVGPRLHGEGGQLVDRVARQWHVASSVGPGRGGVQDPPRRSRAARHRE